MTPFQKLSDQGKNTDNSPHPPFITLAFAVAREVLGKNQTKAREGACKMVIPRFLLAS